ncbi:NAD(P)-dependent alcohol dehydrogenase [Aspergillus mulundensis]|uniref:Enoyl reductase (ER) domain-containing protein n=1 Tax=Aspergillus mulundensis TaxID=1810919 RepID=A0A3D8RL02_9EURO|nr:hypothetical protein DSM5745_07288 [Aspergillus mulundensis]RDW74626.1 hypothetical protein DSM5745_07288 [Aspergillus mulundensis]
MSQPPIPATMKAWLYTSTHPSVIANLTLHTSTRSPPPPSYANHLLIKVHSTSLNPADHKVPQQLGIPFSGGRTLVCSLPASPGLDFAGEIVSVHPKHKGEFKPGDKVYGCLARPRTFGTAGEYILADANDVAILPEGVSPEDAACLGVSVRTAYQSLKNYLDLSKPEFENESPKVFINGGSGGCGVFAIQIAKMLGCHVTTTCSSRNVELLTSLGADEVLDYTKTNVTETLKGKGLIFDLVIDHIGLPANLYAESHHFLKPAGAWVQVGAASIMTAFWRAITPRCLGGGRRRLVPLMLANSKEDLVAVGELVRDKKIRIIKEGDKAWDFERLKEAYELLASGRARGKIVVRVAE